MNNRVCMNDLKCGEKAVVKKMNADVNIKRRLQDIGLIDGTQIECIGKSPLGDPIAFMIRGAVIAIRNEDSSKIIVDGGIWD